MSTKRSTLGRATRQSGPSRAGRPFLRGACALLVSASVSTLWACSDATTQPPVGPVEAPGPQERISEVARAMASAMNSAGVRLDVLAAMRSSPRVDHGLILGDYLLEPSAEELLARSADAMGVTGPEFVALVRGIGELEFLVPVTGHRLRWTGSSRVAVASHWNSDVFDFQVYEPTGDWLEVLNERDWKSVDAYEALFVVRPRETDGTRIGRQPDVPGPVIQDPGDGQQAVVLSWRVAGGEEVSFDVGRFGSTAEFRAAVAETMETRGVWTGSWTPGTGALADGDGDCDPLAVCPPSGGDGDPLPPTWGDPSTFVDRVLMTKDLDFGGGDDGDMELKLIMWFENPVTGAKAARCVWKHYDVKLNDPLVRKPDSPEYDPAIWHLCYASPIRGGWPAFVKAVEMDPAWALNPDDNLGTRDLNPRDNGRVMDFFHKGDHAMELTLSWETDEDPDDDDETHDRGRSG